MVGSIARVPLIGPRLLLRAHRRGFGFDVVSWAEFADLVVAKRPDAVSVDVFETCIVRDLAGDRPIEDIIDWQVENRRGGGFDGVNLRERIAAAAETEMCRPIDGAAEALDTIRSVVGGITFISDTDRSSDVLEGILRDFGQFVDGDRMIASCEEGVTKSDGPLFSVVWPKPRRVVWHAGNNVWSDGVMAAANGIRPFEIPTGNMTRYEKAMSTRPTTFGPALAAASRSARAQLEHERHSGALDDNAFQLRLLGAQVAGPVMAAFVLWVAEECRQHDIGHLSFLARDGELPMRVARAMSADHLDGLATSYLHCNRLIVTLASASSVGVDKWLREGTEAHDSFLEANRHVIPFSRLLDRIGFGLADVASVLGPKHPLSELRADQELPRDAVDEWHELLFDPTAVEMITERSLSRRELLWDHLQAQGVDARPLAMVDVGWRGRMAWLLSAVLRDHLDHEPLHLHFGGDKVIPGLENEVQIKRFVFDGMSSPAPLLTPVSTIETITASGKRRVVDYRRTDDGEVELVYDKSGESTSVTDEHGHLTEVWGGAIKMAEFIPSSKSLNERGLETVSLVPEVVDLLDRWWNRPTRAEASAFGTLKFEHDEAGTVLRPVVKPYAMSDMGGRRQARQWIPGSIAVSSLPYRCGVRLVHFFRRIRRRI